MDFIFNNFGKIFVGLFISILLLIVIVWGLIFYGAKKTYDNRYEIRNFITSKDSDK